MPGPDGFETLEAIRGFSQVPVIMLTARNEEYDKLNGFRLGVDDYVAKPFSPKELMARIGAVLRRTQVHTSAPVIKELAFGGLSIFPDSRIVTLDEKKISLPPKEFDLLYKPGTERTYRPEPRQTAGDCMGVPVLRGCPHRGHTHQVPAGTHRPLPEADPDCMGSGV